MNSTIVKINKDGKVFINDKEAEYDDAVQELKEFFKDENGNIIRVSVNKIEDDTK